MVPYEPYAPTHAGGLYGGARGVGLEAVDVCSVSAAVPPVVAEYIRAGSGETLKESPLDTVVPDDALVELVRMESVLKVKNAQLEGWTVRSALVAMKE